MESNETSAFNSKRDSREMTEMREFAEGNVKRVRERQKLTFNQKYFVISKYSVKYLVKIHERDLFFQLSNVPSNDHESGNVHM